MSQDWTREELEEEVKERIAEGESMEKILRFIWAIIERAYMERDEAEQGRY